MKDNCTLNEEFHIFPIKNIQGTPFLENISKGNLSDCLDTDYNTMWERKGTGCYIILEPDYETNNPKQRKINQIHISFNKGNEKKYKFIIQTSDEVQYFTFLTNQLESSGRTDALEPYYLPNETDSKFIKIIFNGNNKDDWTRVHTVLLVYDYLQPEGKSYVAPTF